MNKGASIRTKLMRVILLTHAAVLILICATYFIYEVVTFRSNALSQLATLSRIIATNSTAAVAFENKEDANEILSALKADKNIIAACIYVGDQQVFVQYPDSLSRLQFPMKIAPDGYRFNSGYLQGFQPIMMAGNRLGTLYVKSDMKIMYSRLTLYSLIALVFIVISTFFAYLLFRQLQKLITKPILNLADTAKAISDGKDYRVRANQSGNDEIGILTQAFNHMLDQIEQQNGEITGFTQTLEQRIRERTLELGKTNDDLIRQNELVETIIDSSVDIIAVLDKDLKYLILNKHGETVYKFKESEVLGRKITNVFPQLENSEILQDIRRALKGEMVYNPNYVSPIINQYLENYYIPLKDKNNENVRILMIGHDITQIMDANRKLKEINKELENSNQSLEQFAYIASHDLQEPLRKIHTFSELSEKNIHHPEIAKRYLTKIISSSDRMSELIRAILNFSRLSQTDIEWERTDLNQVLANVKNDLEFLIMEKHAEIQAEKLPVVNGIPLQLTQLFLNLISNSLKFCEAKPLITITCTLLSNEKSRPDGLDSAVRYFMLSFQDNGIGFEQQYANRIFEIFQRIHDRNYPGTGIGLALCKKIADNHQGRITVTSTPGKGSIFRIYIPEIPSFPQT